MEEQVEEYSTGIDEIGLADLNSMTADLNLTQIDVESLQIEHTQIVYHTALHVGSDEATVPLKRQACVRIGKVVRLFK